jgi:peptidyl-prolyl cis-trans isomerase D
MTRTRLLVVSLLVVATASCAAFKDAMTAHQDVVARAGSQELTIDELAGLLANSEVPLRPDAVRTLSQLWVNYQLLGHAGAHGDSLGTVEDADAGMWSAIAQLKTRKYYDSVSTGWDAVDTTKLEDEYNKGALLAASHILLAKVPDGMSATANDSIKREAERLQTTLTSQNFAAVARARSEDPGSKERGGDYGVFDHQQMVGEFNQGILSVPPGEISKVVETQYGYHIIRRHTWAEAREQFSQMYPGIVAQRAESTYFDQLESGANVNVKSGAAKVVKAVAEDVDAYRDDRTVIATARSGNLTAGRLAQWMAAFPPQSRMRAQVMQVPDSVIPVFVKNIMRNELLLRAADEAKLGPDSAEVTQIRGAFHTGVASTMRSLNVLPSQLADSTSEAGREALAGARIDDYLAKLLRNEGDFVEVPEQLVLVLRDKYEARLIPAGIERALAEATKLRAAADSLKADSQPPTSVPLPGPDTGAGSGAARTP